MSTSVLTSMNTASLIEKAQKALSSAEGNPAEKKIEKVGSHNGCRTASLVILGTGTVLAAAAAIVAAVFASFIVLAVCAAAAVVFALSAVVTSQVDISRPLKTLIGNLSNKVETLAQKNKTLEKKNNTNKNASTPTTEEEAVVDQTKIEPNKKEVDEKDQTKKDQAPQTTDASKTSTPTAPAAAATPNTTSTPTPVINKDTQSKTDPNKAKDQAQDDKKDNKGASKDNTAAVIADPTKSAAPSATNPTAPIPTASTAASATADSSKNTSPKDLGTGTTDPQAANQTKKLEDEQKQPTQEQTQNSDQQSAAADAGKEQKGTTADANASANTGTSSAPQQQAAPPTDSNTTKPADTTQTQTQSAATTKILEEIAKLQNDIFEKEKLLETTKLGSYKQTLNDIQNKMNIKQAQQSEILTKGITTLVETKTTEINVILQNIKASEDKFENSTDQELANEKKNLTKRLAELKLAAVTESLTMTLLALDDIKKLRPTLNSKNQKLLNKLMMEKLDGLIRSSPSDVKFADKKKELQAEISKKKK